MGRPATGGIDLVKLSGPPQSDLCRHGIRTRKVDWALSSHMGEWVDWIGADHLVASSSLGLIILAA